MVKRQQLPPTSKGGVIVQTGRNNLITIPSSKQPQSQSKSLEQRAYKKREAREKKKIILTVTAGRDRFVGRRGERRVYPETKQRMILMNPSQ